MISTLRYYVEKGKNPYLNLARERWLMENCPDGQCILYLWQNARTVVIGRNQNAFKECRIAQLKDDGGFLTRRLSGGGAVFHDDGNLNFTFLVPTEDYDVSRQLEVIIEMCRSFGIKAEKSGRNDVLCDGRKFSGNAFYEHKNRSYHHGTLLLNVDTESMSKYLSPSKAKLKSKGVDSVRSRVVNLSALSDEINVESVKTAMIKAFEKVYGHMARPVSEDEFDMEKIEKYRDEFSSWEWLYGRDISFDMTFDGEFSWGEIQLGLKIDKGIVSDVTVFSDSMDWELSERVRSLCLGKRFDELHGILENQGEKAMADISGLIRE